jgi:hypothetical protein
MMSQLIIKTLAPMVAQVVTWPVATATMIPMLRRIAMTPKILSPRVATLGAYPVSP